MIYEEIVINKPIFENNVGIRDKYIEHAIALGRKLKITIADNGITGIHDPIQWKKTGKKISKVFLLPNQPMILWQNNVKPMTKEEIEKYEEIEFGKNL